MYWGMCGLMCGTLSAAPVGRRPWPRGEAVRPQLAAVLGQRRTPELTAGLRHAFSAAQECAVSWRAVSDWGYGAFRIPRGG